MKNSLILLLTLGLCAGCGAWTEVAKDKLLKKIDNMLNEMDVKRKDIQLENDRFEARNRGIGQGEDQGSGEARDG